MSTLIKNTVIPKDIKKFLTYTATDKQPFSYEAFLPRPKDLMISCPCGWEGEPYEDIFRSYMQPSNFQTEVIEPICKELYNIEITQNHFIIKIREALKQKGLYEKVLNYYRVDDNYYRGYNDNDIMNPFEDIFKGYFNNRRYNAFNWYDWSFKNWGVKWDAYEVKIKDDRIEFLSPDKTPKKIWEHLAKRFDFEVYYQYC